MDDSGGVDVCEVGGIEGAVADGDAVEPRHRGTGSDGRHGVTEWIEAGVQDVHVL